MYMHIFILCSSQNKKDLQTKRFKVNNPTGSVETGPLERTGRVQSRKLTAYQPKTDVEISILVFSTCTIIRSNWNFV